MISKNIFREYDIRGIADDDLTDENVTLIGKAFATFMLAQGRRRLVVGRDLRLSSDRLRDALVAAMASCGADIIDVGVWSTHARFLLSCSCIPGTITPTHVHIVVNRTLQPGTKLT